ncbi:hypothetical protein N7478_011448 [Penicillium angulare]|uniref:uncharacterized protein n=1 Tax=Penicillium angulare TaxID=116970 RepID=UPI002540F34E|nr:uncharacterized protein N7478_011448 [Penicillium angulare]KAJ5263843.1 hypothetical protein N7478_011448 [Penicillium angulare]
MVLKFTNIATSSQWITFPVSAKEQVRIHWEVARNKYENTYYVAKCYYGILEEKVPTPEFVANKKLLVPSPIVYKGKKRMTVLGETKIFIAAEFFEDEYARSQTDLIHFHLKDIARDVGAENESPWVTMKLNGAFCYGQSRGVLGVRRRYIVYHPSVGLGIRRPKVWQHRFTDDNDVTDAVMKGLEGSAKNVPKPYKPLGSLLSNLGKLLHSTGQAQIGHELKVFLDDTDLKKIPSECSELVYLGEEAKLKRHMAKIQAMESSATGNAARDFKPKNLLAPTENDPVLPGQPEANLNPVDEVIDQGLRAEAMIERVEEVLNQIEEHADDLDELEIHPEGARLVEEVEEAESEELDEEEEGRPNSSQHDRPLEREGQDKSEERREEIVGRKPRKHNSVVDNKKDTSLLAVFSQTRPQTQARPRPKVIIKTQVDGQKPVSQKRIFERHKSSIGVHNNPSEANPTVNFTSAESKRNPAGQERGQGWRNGPANR